MWSAHGKRVEPTLRTMEKTSWDESHFFWSKYKNRRFKQYTSWNNIISYHAHRTSHQVASKWPKSSWSPEICVWEPHGETNEIHLKHPNIKITEAPATTDQAQDGWSNTCMYQDHFHHGNIVMWIYSTPFDFEVSRLVPQLSLLKFKISARCYQSPVALFASNLGGEWTHMLEDVCKGGLVPPQ